MKLFFWPLLCSLMWITSCGNSENGPEEDTESAINSIDSIAADSLLTGPGIYLEPSDLIDVEHLLSLNFKDSFSVPLNIDSTFIAEIDAEKSEKLSAAEMSFLTQHFMAEGIAEWGMWDIEKAMKIDSLRRSGELEAYWDNLDIGMIKNSDAFAGEKIYLDSHRWIYLWGIDYSTFEACPYAEGRVIYGTLIVDGKVSNCYLLGEESNGGDPPSWGETKTYSEVTPTSISIRETSLHGEEDMDGKEIYESYISEGLITITDSTFEYESVEAK